VALVKHHVGSGVGVEGVLEFLGGAARR
jgi:hypothetical protein